MDELFREVDRLARILGFRPLPDREEWQSSYALLSLARVSGATLEETWFDAESALQARLTTLNRAGSWPDAYLVLVLEAPPSAGMVHVARKAEADTHTCRKHVIWPEAGPDPWRRSLERITCLPLPPPVPPAPPPTLPDHPAGEQALLKDVLTLGYRGARKKRALSLEEKEGPDAD